MPPEVHERKIDEPDRPRAKEMSPSAGSLTDFFQTSFFPGAIEAGFLQPEDAQAIPGVINDLVVSLFPRDGEEKLFSGAVVISSIAKEIAWQHVTGAIPRDFWADYQHIHEVMKTLKTFPISSVREYAWSFDETRVDMDIKLLDAQKVSTRTLAKQVAHHFHVQNIVTEPLSGSEQEQFQFDHGGYIIRVLCGPSPTNAAIDLMKMSILETKNGQELFHIDVSKAGGLEDKRSGRTTLKQDACVATLSVHDGIARYHMDTQALEVMRHQDSFDATSDDPIKLLELFLRGLRQNLLHIPREKITEQMTEYIRLVDGSMLSLPQLEMFFPLFISASSEDNASLFSLRRSMRSAMLQGARMVPENNPSHMRMLQKELHICLQRDPYLTIQALRDTGIALAIPRLRSLSDVDWNNVLSSEELLMDLAKGTQYPRRRSFEYMQQQRAIYLGYNKSEHRHFDGLERFMRALDPRNKGREWEAYLDLWRVRGELGKIQSVVFELTRGQQRGILFDSGEGKLRILRDNGAAIEEGEVPAVLAALSKNTLAPLGDWRSQIEAGLSDMENITHAEWMKEAIQRRKQRVEAADDKQRLEEKKLGSIGLLAAILRLAPSGLTPREIRSIYDVQTQEHSLKYLSFDNAFCELKLTGFVAKNTIQRVDKVGDIIDMDIFSWHVPQPKKILINPQVRRELFPYYVEVVQESENSSRDVPIGNFTKMLSKLARETFIETPEVILSLSEEDVPCLTLKRGLVRRANYYEYILVLQKTLTKYYEDLDEV